jgi:hypothetical protein
MVIMLFDKSYTNVLIVFPPVPNGAHLLRNFTYGTLCVLDSSAHYREVRIRAEALRYLHTLLGGGSVLAALVWLCGLSFLLAARMCAQLRSQQSLASHKLADLYCLFG